MFDIISGSRSAEIQESKKFRKVLLAEIFFCKFELLLAKLCLTNSSIAANAPMSFAPALTLIVYAVIASARNDASFFAARAFTSLSLISLLTSPVLTLVQAIPQFIQCLSSFDRVQEYYREPIHPLCAKHSDLQSTKVERTSIEMQSLGARRTSFDGKPIVAFYDQDFAWNQSGTAILKDVNISIAANRLTAIIGPTGSGKTTFLDSILGETISLRGRAERNFAEAAYCSQMAWLIDGTVQNNITCSIDENIDERWYQKVLWACGLEVDMDTLRQGDQTLVGSDGSKLSGGQKQRVVRD
jgi:ABC-type multidrug transport system fused ATPase/permease subunit